jgi:hypothetical protein
LNEDEILELDILRPFFDLHGVPMLDLTSDILVEKEKRSLQVPRVVRDVLGKDVTFVEVPELPNRRSWRLHDSLWINLANPTMKEVHTRLQRGALSDVEIVLANVLMKILQLNLDDAVEYAIFGLLEGGNAPH